MKPIILLATCFSAVPLNAAILQSFPGPFDVSGGGMGTLLVNSSSDAGNWIDTYSAGTATTALYYTFTMTVSNNAGETGDGGFFGGVNLYVGNSERLLVGNNWLSTAWSANSNDIQEIPLNANLVVGGDRTIIPTETATFVVRIDQSTSSATVWFNPDLGLSEALQDAGITTNITGLGTGDTFDSIYLRTGGGSALSTFSQIEFRNDSPFGAVPEPASALLISVASLGLVRRRR